jgi:hypothetical protein
MADGTNYFIKLMVGEDLEELLESGHNVLVLLLQIAVRTRKGTTRLRSVSGLKPGEAFLGDHHKIGLTQQQYRTAKKQAEEAGYATFRATNKGTIAKLSDATVCDLSALVSNRQDNKPATDQQQASNEPATTNLEVRVKKEKERVKKRPYAEQRIDEDRDKFDKLIEGALYPLLSPSLGSDNVKYIAFVKEHWIPYRYLIKKPLVGRAIGNQTNRASKVGAIEAVRLMDYAMNHDWTDWHEQKPFEKKDAPPPVPGVGDFDQNLDNKLQGEIM